jgi:tetratricopeptide (TPR) repeat protein
MREAIFRTTFRTLVPALLSVALAGIATGGSQPPRLDPQLEAVLNAVRDGEFRVMAAAIDGGMAVDAKAPNGMTALHVAAVLGRERFVSWLLERGAAVNDPAQNGITPLNRAAMGGHLGTMELLLEAGADVNAAARWGATPLLSAVDRGQTEAVRLLLSAGADPGVTAMNGDTALSLARKKEHRDIVAVLSEDPDAVRIEVEAGADRRASRADTHHRTGVAFDDAGDIRRAIESYRLALEQEPDNPLIRYRLGRALHRFGEREALVHLIEAVRGWEATIEAGEELAPIVRPALEDACGVLGEAGRTEETARCRAALARSRR